MEKGKNQESPGPMEAQKTRKYAIYHIFFN